ncbi:MAG: sugar ABC transporter ATP-binding protein, partial [Rubrivivax sp.]
MHSSAATPAAAADGRRPDPIAVRGVSKRFGSTAALTDVSLDGRAGSIHAITGENGAGKSTLMKLLAGVHRPDAGQIVVNGRPTVLHGPMDARHAGISTVFQELTVLPNLTVGENLMLGREPRRFGLLDRARMFDEARAVLARIGIELDPRRACDTLSVGEQQLVEIAKGVSADASVFIFDEPTAALNRAEVDKLEALLHGLKAQHKLVFYISHRLDEIFRLCDTVTVLKDGCWVATEPASALDTERLITLMVGRPLQALFPPRRPRATGAEGAGVAIALDVRSLTPTRGAPALGWQLRHGEIVGLGGLEGQGQREIVRSLAGVLKPHASDVWKADAHGTLQPFDPADGVVRAVAQGVGLIPEDRKLEGLYLDLPIADNIGLGRL